MNNQLKSQIVLKYGTQADFAVAVATREEKVSRVIRGRAKLSDVERQRWADLLGQDSTDLFGKEAGHDQES